MILNELIRRFNKMDTDFGKNIVLVVGFSMHPTGTSLCQFIQGLQLRDRRHPKDPVLITHHGRIYSIVHVAIVNKSNHLELELHNEL